MCLPPIFIIFSLSNSKGKWENSKEDFFKITVIMPIMSYNKMGIYINQPRIDQLKIIYNKRDAARVKDPNKILKVNKNNVKFGKSKNLEARHREYKEIFGENTNFKIVLQIDDYEKLVNFENHLKTFFLPFCLRSTSNGVQMEWMENISFTEAENFIKQQYKKFFHK